MNNIIENKKTLIFCVILILVTGVIIEFINNKEKIFGNPVIYEEYVIDKYEANTYIPVYVTETDMASKYLNDFKYLLMNNLEEAYNVINDSYKEVKYANYEDFEKKIINEYSVAFYTMSVEKYSVLNRNGYKFYYIYDKRGDLYIFKEISIMDYEVYLDDFTVSIK